jgi:cytochrome c-type biogenesis protein
MDLNSWTAFSGGVLSFMSPCVIPLVPVYMGYLVDTTIEKDGKNYWVKLFTNAFGFLLGLLLVFSILGLTATSLGLLLLTKLELFRKISGVVIILFGLFHSGLLKLNFLNRDRKVRFKKKKTNFLNSMLLGMAFSFGWTPCVGPILGSILVLAANTTGIVDGISLLAFYSAGFSIPFLLMVVFMEPLLKLIDRNQKVVMGVKVITSVFIILMGVFVYMDYFSRIATWLS